MKHEDLTRLELEKIEAIHDLVAAVRKLDSDVVDIGNALLASMNRPLVSQPTTEASNSRRIPKADEVLDQFQGR